MNRSSKRFLFQSHNRRGLGHLMRGLNLAKEIRSLASYSDILFYTRSRSAETIGGRKYRYFLETDLQGLSHWSDIVQSFSPHVIIYDTLLHKSQSREDPLPSTRHVYIMRKCKEKKQKELFQHAFLDQVDLILIPHTPLEFEYELPSKLKEKSIFVGPIVRSPDQNIQSRLKKKYGLKKQNVLITSTVGGGGFEKQAEVFFSTVFAIHQKLFPTVQNLRHFLIKGPNFTKPINPVEGMAIITLEAEMVNLFAISDLVIAEGGYNSVNEIRVAKAPAIFLPGKRNYDDQEERVHDLEKRGLAFVFKEQSPEFIAEKVLEIVSSESCLPAIREKYNSDQVARGNRKAAEYILEIVNK